MTPEQEALRERVAEALWQAEHYRIFGSPRTVDWSEAGPSAQMQWRSVAPAAIAVVLKEAAKVAGMLGGSVRQGNIDILYIPPTAKDAATAILSLIPQGGGK